ncbi:metallophosphoesterase [uncultured Oxalicibacterium sp.]|uniref:metallophosphoesterase family protein n=1 Tax=uncultured Oxalicibacterium sp. TaxID=1168540 RepID=UPI0025E599CD|nr:metallophosphoesterase [uncultured Oxalicibacterium sp.]
MSVILQISDPHFGTERPPVVAALKRLSQALHPTMLIVSGDITQRAKATEFAAAHHFLDSLAVPSMLVVPGNHDIPLFDLISRLFAPYRKYRAAFGDDLAPIVNTRDVLVIGVNTTRRYRHIQGEVSPAQIAAAASHLQHARPEQLRIVVTHQPVHVVCDEDREDLLRGHREAIKAWSAAGADLILGGHIHRPSFSALHEVFDDLPQPIWGLQAGTSLSARIRFDAGNSVNVIRHDDSDLNCVIERWDYVDDADAFLLHTTHTMQRNMARTSN